MFGIDSRTITQHQLAEQIAALLEYGGLVEITQLYDRAALRPSLGAARLAAHAAVAALFAHDLGASTGPLASEVVRQLPAPASQSAAVEATSTKKVRGRGGRPSSKRARSSSSSKTKALSRVMTARAKRSPSKPQLLCPYCQKPYTSQVRLDNHKLDKHPGEVEQETTGSSST